MKKKANVGFGDWLAFFCKYDDGVPWIIEMGALVVITFLICIGTGYLWWPPFLVIGLVAAFIVTLLWRWQKALTNPPWYLKEEKDEQA
jgi:fatty acid desaturase